MEAFDLDLDTDISHCALVCSLEHAERETDVVIFLPDYNLVRGQVLVLTFTWGGLYVVFAYCKENKKHGKRKDMDVGLVRDLFIRGITPRVYITILAFLAVLEWTVCS